jgi:hypothetical protein
MNENFSWEPNAFFLSQGINQASRPYISVTTCVGTVPKISGRMMSNVSTR